MSKNQGKPAILGRLGMSDWRAMRDSDENYIYSISLHGPTK